MHFAPRLNLLTGWAEFGNRGGIAPSDGPSGRSELERTERGHVITKTRFKKLNRVRRQGILQLAILVKAFTKWLWYDSH
jgi:hypothetical protein